MRIGMATVGGKAIDAGGKAIAVGGKAARFAVRKARRPIGARWRERVLATGVDDTAASANRRTLVVAPHPDDETIGCGATMARKRAAGTSVDVVIVCDGRHSHASSVITPQRLAETRAAESLEACSLLGVEPERVRFLGFEELTLWRCLDDVAEALAAVIAEVDPEEILVVTDQDWHTDHQATHVALLRAVARCDYRGLLGAYPVWFWHDGPWRTVPIAPLWQTWRELLAGPLAARRLPPARLVHTEEYGPRKRAAFACYRSQTTNLTGEAGWAVFEPGWIESYLRSEVFFPVDEAAVAGSRNDRREQRLGEGGPVQVGGAGLVGRRRSGRAASAAIATVQDEPTGRRLVALDASTLSAGALPDGTGTVTMPDGTGTVTTPDEAVGAITARFETGAVYAPAGRCGVLFRQDGLGGGWRLVAGCDDVELAYRSVSGDPWTVVASARGGVHARELVSLAVRDDGERIDCRRDGAPLFDGLVTDARHGAHRGCGPICDPAEAVWLHRFEAYGRPS
ncbi:MAG: PIG-L family deacetylase [Acidimicrobiales bacterium]|nr:PIG-L family deacetylase [Acidimicrobiales bacterium]